MNKYLNKYVQEHEKMNEYYNARKYRTLKYAALTAVALGVILLLCIAFYLDHIPQNVMLIMRVCAGLCAITFVVLVTIITYRANKEHVTNRRNNR